MTFPSVKKKKKEITTDTYIHRKLDNVLLLSNTNIRFFKFPISMSIFSYFIYLSYLSHFIETKHSFLNAYIQDLSDPSP